MHRRSWFCFASDLLGEGVEPVLSRLRTDGQADAITIAASYHAARDVFAHNPRFRVHSTPGGVCFVPRHGAYSERGLRPTMLPTCDGSDLLASVCDTSARRGMAVHAWVVYCHHDPATGEGFPGAVRNVFGEPYAFALCPSARATRDYAHALTEDVCRYDIESVVAESLHYLPFEHGGHHERDLPPLADTTRFLLSVCFCDDCATRAREGGLDVHRLRYGLRARIERAFAAGSWLPEHPAPATADESDLSDLDDELGEYLGLQRRAVTALVTECAEIAARAGVRFVFLDTSAGVSGWQDGVASGPLGPALARWRGVELAEIARVATIMALPYGSDPERVDAELRAYREAIGDAALAVGLRPMAPDCTGRDNLRAKLAVLDRHGIGRVDYYNYGFAPLAALRMVAGA